MTGRFAVVVDGRGNEGTMISPGVAHQVPHAIEAAVTGTLGWGVKYVLHSLQKEWREMKDTLSSIKTTTQVQAENHLTTIQGNTAQTNVLLEKVVENQIELNGWLKGRASRD